MDPQTEQLIARGRQAYEHREYAAALADFRELLATHPNFADIQHLTGVCLSFLGDAEAALEHFDRAVELNDGYIEAHLNRALTLNELGRFDEARSAFERAWQAEQREAGDFSAAVSARLANAHAAVGDLYLEAGAAAKAVEQFRLALSMRPRFVDIRQRLAHALLQLGALDEAETELARALEQNSRLIAARVELGLVHFRRGATAAASREWEAALAMEPGNPQARAFLAMLGATVPPRPSAGA